MISPSNSNNKLISVTELVTCISRRVSLIFFLSLLAFSCVFAIAQYFNRLHIEKERLASISQQATRILAGEILAGNSAAITPLIDQLKAEWKLKDVFIAHPNDLGCKAFQGPCYEEAFELSSDHIRIVLIGEAPEFPTQWLLTLFFALAIIIALLYFYTKLVSENLNQNLLIPLQKLSRDPTQGEELHGVEEIRSIARNFKHYILERDQNQARADLLEKKAQLGELASQVIHDLASPVSVLSHLQKQEGVSNPILSRALQRIEEISLDLKEKYRQGHEPEAIPLFDLLNDVVKEKQIQWQHVSHLKIQLTYPPQLLDAFISGHRSDLFRVFSNLLNNSVQSTLRRADNQKHIESQFAKVVSITLSLAPDGMPERNAVKIRLEDNGIGISREHIQKLLTGHGREVTEANAGSGMGLGFSGAKRILQAHSWQIAIDSVPGEGATIHLMLPLTLPPKWFFPNFLDKLREAKQILWIDDCQDFKILAREKVQKHTFANRVTWLDPEGIHELDLKAEIANHTLFLVDMKWHRKPLAGLNWVVQNPELLRHGRDGHVFFVSHDSQSKALQSQIAALDLKLCGKDWVIECLKPPINS